MTQQSSPNTRPDVFCTFDLGTYFAPQRWALFRHLNFQKCSQNGFVHVDFEICFAPQQRALSRHLNFQKRSNTEVPSAFWLRHVLCATTACTFSTSQLPKVVRSWYVLYILTSKCASRRNGVHFSTSQLPKVARGWCVLYILTSKCASRHNGVHFFDIATSKSGPILRCLHVLTSKCASRHNGVQLFSSHLARWFRTRRFGEPTFRLSGATMHLENTVIRSFSTSSRTCIFFLLILSLLWSCLFFSSPLWLFPPLPFHLSILSEVWLLNFLRPVQQGRRALPCVSGLKFHRGFLWVAAAFREVRDCWAWSCLIRCFELLQVTALFGDLRALKDKLVNALGMVRVLPRGCWEHWGMISGYVSYEGFYRFAPGISTASFDSGWMKRTRVLSTVYINESLRIQDTMIHV